MDGTAVRLDPLLLYQRLVVAAKAIVDIESVFKYELCSYPPALFDNHLLLREPQKNNSASQYNMGSYEHNIPP